MEPDHLHYAGQQDFFQDRNNAFVLRVTPVCHLVYNLTK